MALPYVLKYIDEGEHQTQDFKMRIDDSKKIARTLVAFANSDGGRILIGVKDNGSVSGINADEELHMIEAAAKMYCRPVVEYSSQVWKVEYKSVLEVNIQPTASLHHSALTDEGVWKSFIRISDQTLATPAVLVEVWKNEGNDRPQKYFHTEKEKRIFSALENSTGISTSQLAKITRIPRKVLTAVLARLIRWNLIELQFEKETPMFRLKT